jgi:diguanylate cyclase (GGDEF)-like protein
LLWQYLPSFGATRDSWIVVQSAGDSQKLVGDSTKMEALELVADRALSGADLRQAQAEGVVLDGYVCFPMVVAIAPIAAMGIPAAEITSMTARRRIGAVAALIAIAVKNAELYRQTQDKGVRDSLTGCYNRGYTLEAIENELRRARRSHAPVSILMFDIDHFKQINDKHGHLAGDRAIVEVAQQLQSTVRASDIKCRYGGDEFIVVLPETDLVGAARVAENLRSAISRTVVKFRSEAISVTITIGAACSHGEDLNVTALVANADAALYDAKRKGRNRVGVAPATGPLATER